MSEEIYIHFSEQRKARSEKRKANKEYGLEFLKRKTYRL